MEQEIKRGRRRQYPEDRINRKIYFKKEDYELVQQAARALGMSVTAFVSEGSVKLAKIALEPMG